MSAADQDVEGLVEQTQGGLSLSSPAGDSDATSSSPSPSSVNGSTSSSTISSSTGTLPRQYHGIGSGSGGPPARLSSAGTGGPSANTYRGGASGGPGTGGPGSRTRANEMTRQSATAKLPPGLQARLAANANRASPTSTPSSSGSSPSGTAVFHLGHNERMDAMAFLNTPGVPSPSLTSPNSTGSFRAPQGLRPAPGLPPGARPQPGLPAAGLAGRRAKGPGLKLSDLGSGGGVEGNQGSEGTGQSGNSLSGSNANIPPTKRRLAPPGRLAEAGGGLMSTAFDMHKNIVDPSGRLNFGGKAVLSASGVEFRNGTSFNINMDDLELQDELGKGAYGTVRKVRHTKTGVEMAMKEIRLELDDSKLNAIIMELDILHRATSSNIVEFYGAFFFESCVYYCIEVMDAGSLENLYDGPCSVPEDVLARISNKTVRGLRFLKDELQIMHRDVKPTNILVNRKGNVKLCDFGVSGQLEKSLAKTNIGCQSYMAPERIKGESQNLVGTYTVASDVWSLGLTIVETTLGTYPYPPETYSNVFAQLQAIVHGDPPQLPSSYSNLARDFVAGCLEKVPQKRSTYKQMLEHPWLVQDDAKGEDGVDMQGWIALALERRAQQKERMRSEATL